MPSVHSVTLFLPLTLHLSQPCPPTALTPFGSIPISYTISLWSPEMEGRRNFLPWLDTEKWVQVQQLPIQTLPYFPQLHVSTQPLWCTNHLRSEPLPRCLFVSMPSKRPERRQLSLHLLPNFQKFVLFLTHPKLSHLSSLSF